MILATTNAPREKRTTTHIRVGYELHQIATTPGNGLRRTRFDGYAIDRRPGILGWFRAPVRQMIVATNDQHYAALRLRQNARAWGLSQTYRTVHR